MKAKSLCAVALATLFLGGSVVSAAPMDPMDTNGTVKVENGKIDTEDGLTDPEDPDKKLPVDELPDVIENPNTDMVPLEISHAPGLSFGTVKTATKEVTAFAAANSYTDADGAQKRGALLQFGDLRTDANGYTVSAQLKTQFTQGTNVLNGSTISFANPWSNTATGATGTTPDFVSNFELSLGETKPVATAKNLDKAGKGMWAVEYGSSDQVGDMTDTTDSSVQLAIPANTASSMAGGDYVAVIEWSISNVPGV